MSDSTHDSDAEIPLPPGLFHMRVQTLVEGERGVFCQDRADPFDLYGYRIKQVLCAEQTPFQEVVIADTYNFGRALFMDGCLQSTEDDDALYHEMLVHPAMLSHSRPKDVLIIGGGEGATLREILSYKDVTRVHMVDIDERAVDLCREHLRSMHQGAFDDSRTRLVIDDGRHFIERDNDADVGPFDVVIIDVVDMLTNGPAKSIYTVEFYRHLKARLRPGGIVAVQGMELSHTDYKNHAALVRTLKTQFSEVHSYRCCVPSFLATWGFVVASDWLRPDDAWTPASIDALIDARVGHGWMGHLDGAFLASCLTLCKETRHHLALPGPILRDAFDFVTPADVESVNMPVRSYPNKTRRRR